MQRSEAEGTSRNTNRVAFARGIGMSPVLEPLSDVPNTFNDLIRKTHVYAVLGS